MSIVRAFTRARFFDGVMTAGSGISPLLRRQRVNLLAIMRVADRLQAMLPPVLQRPVVKSAAHTQALSGGIKRDQRRYQYIQLAKREDIAHVELRFADVQTIHHQIAAWVVVQKQKIAGAERMKHGEIDPFACPPELINQRPRISSPSNERNTATVCASRTGGYAIILSAAWRANWVCCSGVNARRRWRIC